MIEILLAIVAGLQIAIISRLSITSSRIDVATARMDVLSSRIDCVIRRIDQSETIFK